MPGVGSFPEGMKDKNSRLDNLSSQCIERKPLFGICLGMQMLFESSEEYGVHEGLGYSGQSRILNKITAKEIKCHTLAGTN